MWQKIMNLYNTNQYFQSFVSGLEGAIITALTTWGGGIPVNKAGWYALVGFIGKAIYGYCKRWMQKNVATRDVVTLTK